MVTRCFFYYLKLSKNYLNIFKVLQVSSYCFALKNKLVYDKKYFIIAQGCFNVQNVCKKS